MSKRQHHRPACPRRPAGFTLLGMLLTCVVIMFLLGAYVRALGEADSIDDFMRGDDTVRFSRNFTPDLETPRLERELKIAETAGVVELAHPEHSQPDAAIEGVESASEPIPDASKSAE